MTELNVAILGYRFMGKAHSNAYRQVSHFFPGKLKFRMKVLCGPEAASLDDAAGQLGWEETATDWRKVVARKDIDVIDICTPNYLHYPMAIAAARAGKHIICEKPPGTNMAQAQEMVRAVEKAGVKHMLMHNYRKIPAVALARQLIKQGRLGRIYHYHGSYLQDWILDPKFPLVWRLQKKLAGSGALGDIASHAADLAQFLILAHLLGVGIVGARHDEAHQARGNGLDPIDRPEHARSGAQDDHVERRPEDDGLPADGAQRPREVVAGRQRRR